MACVGTHPVKPERHRYKLLDTADWRLVLNLDLLDQTVPMMKTHQWDAPEFPRKAQSALAHYERRRTHPAIPRPRKTREAELIPTVSEYRMAADLAYPAKPKPDDI